MKKHSRIAAIVMTAALTASIQALATQDNTDQASSDKTSAPVAPQAQSSATDTPAPVATPPLDVQTPSQPVAVENVLSELKIYPAF
jgi:hypothetical protein